MAAENDSIRSEISGKFQPPVEVLLDPSLLVADVLLTRLADSAVFTSQTQATLDQPTTPHVGNLYVPATFYKSLNSQKQIDLQQTSMWNIFRGQAEGALSEEILKILDQNGVEKYEAEIEFPEPQRANTLSDGHQTERLLQILREAYTFLQSGGILLSRTSTSIEILRDTGVPTLDLGDAELAPAVQDTLTDIGYENPASICAFAVSTASSTVDALVGDVLSENSDLLLYRLGD